MRITGKTAKIGDLIDCGLANIQTGPFGTQLKASEYVDVGIPIINVRNIGFGDIRDTDLEFISDIKAEELSVHRLEKDDIVFGRKGAVERHGLIAYKQVGWVQGSDCLRLRISADTVCQRYVSYFLRTHAHQDWMKALCSFGATMASLNQEIVKRIAIPLPEIAVQRKIAAILTAYDDLIETNKRRIALLEKMAEEIYREWFIRMRFPGHREAAFVKGLPETWTIKKVKEIVDRKRFGQIYRPADLTNEGQVIVIDQSRSDFLGFYDGKPEHKASIEAPIILFGDHSCKMVFMTCPFSLAENVIPFKPIFPMPALFLFHLVKDLARTTEYKRHWTDLTNREVLVPDHELQDAFSELVSDSHLMRKQLVDTNRNLAKTRDLLLPRLISGKLSVEDLDIQFPPSMRDEAPTAQDLETQA